MGNSAREFLRQREFDGLDEYFNHEVPCDSSQVSNIEMLLLHANIDHEERHLIEKKMNGFTLDEAEQTIKYLLANQLNPITSGFKYSQTDIKSQIGKQI